MTDDFTGKIVSFIAANRVSTTEVADALDKSGVLPGLTPLSRDMHKVGRVRTIFTAYGSNYDVHEQIRFTQPGEVVIVFAHECEGKAIFGDLVTKFAVLYRQAEALVVNGLVRDASRLQRERYPVWAQGVTPLGCINTQTEPYPAQNAAQIRDQLDRGVAVCDDGGVVVIPRHRMNEEMLDRLHKIELQEDVWYYCLNTLKWDTKRIVCDKEYKNGAGLFPEQFKEIVK
ncbi:MAG: RraA family protein [Nitrospirae bacterium]|nr:RraA family protein [Magnetococcales bacterium]